MKLNKLNKQKMTKLERMFMSKLHGGSPDKWPCYDGCQKCEGVGSHMSAAISTERVSMSMPSTN